MRRDNINVWTDDMIREFGKLHCEVPELSFTQIAVLMSITFNIELSRNACIGKARRLGLPMRDQNKTLRKPVEKKPRSPRFAGVAGRRIVVDAPIAPAFAEAPAGQALSIYQLRDGCCRWPLGEMEDRPPYTYCGKQAEFDSSWCFEHFCRAHVRARAEWS